MLRAGAPGTGAEHPSLAGTKQSARGGGRRGGGGGGGGKKGGGESGEFIERLVQSGLCPGPSFLPALPAGLPGLPGRSGGYPRTAVRAKRHGAGGLDCESYYWPRFLTQQPQRGRGTGVGDPQPPYIPSHPILRVLFYRVPEEKSGGSGENIAALPMHPGPGFSPALPAGPRGCRDSQGGVLERQCARDATGRATAPRAGGWAGGALSGALYSPFRRPGPGRRLAL